MIAPRAETRKWPRAADARIYPAERFRLVHPFAWTPAPGAGGRSPEPWDTMRDSLFSRTAALVLATAAAGCATVQTNDTTTPEPAAAVPGAAGSPLLAGWAGPYGGIPPFHQVRVQDFEPAMEAAMAQQMAEIDRIAANPAAPTFENTLATMESAGSALDRVSTLYGVWSSTMNGPEFQAVERTMAPRIAASTPQVLQRFAVHYQTGEPIPQPLVERIKRAATFNQGFGTVEYLAGALIDMKLHLAGTADIDPRAFERETLAQMGMPREIVTRHRTPQFGHVFAGDGYSAGYYSYLWSDVITADAAEAFLEAPGGLYDPGVARRLRENIFSIGNTIDPAEGYRRFRGRDPAVEALMRKRGFAPPAGSH